MWPMSPASLVHLGSILATAIQLLLALILLVYAGGAFLLLLCSNSNSMIGAGGGGEKKKMSGLGSTQHRSLQRPAKVSVSAGLGGEAAEERLRGGGGAGGAGVVWLGRSGDVFVARSPLHSACYNEPYEPYGISAELQRRQLAALERKYGGARRAHKAATVIQKAYREHCLARRFASFWGEGGRGRSISTTMSRGALAPIPPRQTPQLRLHRYPTTTTPLLHHKSVSAPRIQVRVSPQTSGGGGGGAMYYQTGRPSQAQPPPAVRVKAVPTVAVGTNRSTSTERGGGEFFHSASHLPPHRQHQGTSTQAHHVSYTALLHHQAAMYERRLDLSGPGVEGDPYGAFAAPSSPASSTDASSSYPEVSPWSYRDSRALGSPALPRRGGLDSPSSASSDSSPSVGFPPPLPQRIVAAPLRRSSQSPITLVRSSGEEKRSGRGSSPRLSPEVEKEQERRRKRQYRVALNFFNQWPEKGMGLLVKQNFVDDSPAAVAKFLRSRRGLSKAMIGEYLGKLNNSFAQAVLEEFAASAELGGRELDEALRHFLGLFRIPGEAQKIERIIQVFASYYAQANAAFVQRLFRDPDTVFVLSFAIIMLNTDLHTPNLKEDKRMKLEDFVKNLKGIDAGEDIEREYLAGIYARVKDSEFRHGSDHLSQVVKVDRSILPSPKKPSLAVPHRRLVCYCRLYEVDDPGRKQAAHLHQRELFLFNDLLVVTKLLGKGRKAAAVSYSFRQAIPLNGLSLQPFRNQHYQYGLKMSLGNASTILHFQARSEDDQSSFMDDLREAILESEEMEATRIRLELEKQEIMRPSTGSLGRSSEAERDSGLAEDELGKARPLRTKALSSSTLELCPEASIQAPPPPPHHGAQPQPPERRLSLNSDSGMSSTASVGSRESSPKTSTGVAVKLPPYPLSSPMAPKPTPLAALFSKGPK